MGIIWSEIKLYTRAVGEAAAMVQSKAFKGSVSVESFKNRLRLRFRVNGVRFTPYLGLNDTPEHWKTAEAIAWKIQRDIETDNFDPTLQKYNLGKKTHLTVVEPLKPQAVAKLNELWEKFLEYKRPQCSPSTMRYQYRVFSRYLANLPTHDLDKAEEIRDWCIANIPIDSCKRFIVRLNACCDWAVKSKIISTNPFIGMAKEIKLPKSQKSTGMDEINPFTAEQRDRILAAFKTDQFCPKNSRVKHSHYFPLVFFLFNTGCRPSEAVALQWKHVADDLRIITFEQAVVESNNGTVCKSGLKTQPKRDFPCNNRMKDFLRSIKPEDATSKDLIFPSPTGKWIDSNNFRNRIWKPVLKGLNIEYRKLYQTRHTFITLALDSEHGGMDIKRVAQLVGNSPEVIYHHYAGNTRELFVPEF